MRAGCGLLVALVAIAGCGSSGPPPGDLPQAPATQTVRPSETPRSQTASYDLAADERLGGHTLQRHVGRTDAQLAERLRRERNITAASTYTDRETASTVVGAALAESKSKVEAWLARRGSRPNLVL